MLKRLTLISIFVVVVCVSARAQDVTLHSAKFIGDTQFLIVDGDGIHPHPFLLADIIFIGDAQPHDGNQLTIGSATFTFRDSASTQNDIQIGNDVNTTTDNTRDVINEAHVVLRTSRNGFRITLVAAEIAAPTLTTTASGHAITVTSFNLCGAP